MKWLIASDIHGSLPWAKALFERFEAEKADRMLLLGDLFYHGPLSGPPEGYDPQAVRELLMAHRTDFLTVRGNTESEAVQFVMDFPCMAEYALLDVGGHVVFAHHGHNFHEENMPPLRPGDVLLAGHTHVPALEDRGGILYMNPGSAALPLGGSERGYMTLEDGLFSWKTMDGKTWQTYRIS